MALSKTCGTDRGVGRGEGVGLASPCSTADVRFRWLVGGLLFLVTFLATGFVKSYGKLLPAIITEFGDITAFEATCISGLFGMIPLLVSPAVKPFLTSYGHRLLFMLGAALCSLGLFLSSIATSASFLIASLGLCMGFGIGLLLASAFAGAGTYLSSPKTITKTIAVSGGSVGAMVMPFLLGYLLDSLGLRHTFCVLSAAFTLVSLSGIVYGEEAGTSGSPVQDVLLENGSIEGMAESRDAPRWRLWHKLHVEVHDAARGSFWSCHAFLFNASSVFSATMSSPHFHALVEKQEGGYETQTDSLALSWRFCELLGRLIYEDFTGQLELRRSAEYLLTLSLTATCCVAATFCTSFWLHAVLNILSAFASGVLAVCIPRVVAANNHCANKASPRWMTLRWLQGNAAITYRFVAELVRPGAQGMRTKLYTLDGAYLFLSGALYVKDCVMQKRRQLTAEPPKKRWVKEHNLKAQIPRRKGWKKEHKKRR